VNTNNNTEDRLAALEARLRQLEDRAEIFQLMASYGPAVDSCQEREVAALWIADGVYDTDGHCFVGSDEVGKLVDGDMHRAFVSAGSAHVISLPHLVIDGDSAVATGYSRVYICKGKHHEVARASSNRWEFVRTAQGWRVKRRVNRRLVGSGESRQVLAQAFSSGTASAP
jgi:hypothetical protein